MTGVRFIKKGLQEFGYKRTAEAWAKQQREKHAAAGLSFVYSITQARGKHGQKSRTAPWLVYWDLQQVFEPKPNPGELLVFGTNPGGGTKGAKRLGRAHALRYLHATEGPRVHAFDGSEIIELLRDGSLRIYHPGGERLWIIE